MNTVKNVLLTFDYELFQGRKSGSVENCIITPTSRLLNLLDQFGAKSVFFVDMLYVCRLAEIAGQYPKAKADLDIIKEQIIDIANRGHSVFNHLHPHWLDAVYMPKENQWDLTNTSKYSFLALTEQERSLVFDKTMTLLTEILSESRNHPVPAGFRAGGLYIQPFSIFRPYFDKYKIKYDFSALIGVRGQLEDNSNQFDFSQVKKHSYLFAKDVEVEDTAGVYREYALTSLEMPFFYRLYNSLLHRLYTLIRNDYRKYGDGIPLTNKIFRPKRMIGTSVETFSVELLNEMKLPLYLYEAKHNNYLHLLSHPKLISEYNLRMFNKFLNRLTEENQIEFDFEQFILN